MLIFLDKSYYSYTPSVKLAVCALFSCQRAKHVCRLLYIPLRLPPSQSDSCAITCLVIIWLCFFESLASLASWTCAMPKSERWQIVLPPSRYYGELEKVNTRQVFAMIFQCFFKAPGRAMENGCPYMKGQKPPPPNPPNKPGRGEASRDSKSRLGDHILASLPGEGLGTIAAIILGRTNCSLRGGGAVFNSLTNLNFI